MSNQRQNRSLANQKAQASACTQATADTQPTRRSLSEGGSPARPVPASHPNLSAIAGRHHPGGDRGARADLLKLVPGLRWLVTRRWFQFALVLPNLAIFYFFLIAGTFGSPVGNRNIIIVFVWILWWFLLISALVPFASRLWCAMCPFPFFGEWFQRRALVGVRVGKPGVGRNRMWGLNNQVLFTSK